ISVEADVYVLKSVLQHWDDAAARTILESCRDAMPKHAKLLIVERLLPEQALDDAAAVMADLHMMVISGGPLRTLAEIRGRRPKAGLALRSCAPAAGLSIIEATPSN